MTVVADDCSWRVIFVHDGEIRDGSWCLTIVDYALWWLQILVSWCLFQSTSRCAALCILSLPSPSLPPSLALHHLHRICTQCVCTCAHMDSHMDFRNPRIHLDVLWSAVKAQEACRRHLETQVLYITVTFFAIVNESWQYVRPLLHEIFHG